ncbi:hypothetical protein [Paeniglutamicibacter psychrophenolicus]|uniref:hypothetical protein n=1 Tax=Paeniglutamicibacter psychrophenolicus TaxID=257454 RepID=UPI002788359D|nr:hypothetical protein [Paeniglutamicibacter psychrophenolicus]MDQ0093284.1 hypothetical protein [Paeniglutamicibacter psychrophenolicus]
MDEETNKMAPPQGAEELLTMATSILRDRLPLDWSITNFSDVSKADNAIADLILEAPDGHRAEIQIDVRSRFEPRDVASVSETISRNKNSDAGNIDMVVTRYLAKSTRDRLSEAGVSYIDLTGNICLRSNKPALFISDRGADSDPWRGPGRPLGTLKGAPAARVVRALLDFPGPWKIRELVDISKASTGSVYRVVEFLENEALLVRTEDRSILVPEWPRLLRRWSEDYQFLRSNRVTRWNAPRGIEAFLEKVAGNKSGEYAVTGSIAAANWEAYAPARSAMVYCQDSQQLAEENGLRPAESGVNVLLAQPANDVVFERRVARSDGLLLAAPTQTAVDLMTGPGRAPSEAEELLNWMMKNEQSWR